jgi:hypothetical protein
MTNAERIVAVIHRTLDPGPMGAWLRREYYKEFVSVDRPVDHSKIKTSCAIFAHSVLHDAGRLDKKADTIGMPIFNGWLEGLTFSHPAWEDATDSKTGARRKPPPGALFYRAYSKSSGGSESHVGFFVFETSPGMWITAEGGGSPDGVLDAALLKGLTATQIKETNGTLCRLSRGPKDPFAKDSRGRVLVGWFRPELLDGFVGTEPLPDFIVKEPDVSAEPPSDGLITYNPRYVKEWQVLLGVKPDGLFGKITLAASKEKLK